MVLIHCVIQSLSAFIVLPSLVNSHTKQICKDGNKYYTHTRTVSQLHRNIVVNLPDVDIPSQPRTQNAHLVTSAHLRLAQLRSQK